MSVALTTSRYTFRVPTPDGFAVFNASTGATLRLAGADADELSALLSGPPRGFPDHLLDEALVAQMCRNGFLVPADTDEVEPIRERYWASRGNAPIVLLVTTTMDCNLGCYYCYESRSSEALRPEGVADLIAIARDRLAASGKKTLHVDWYGGEPLLNLEFLESASLGMQEFCAERGIRYSASVISNGTAWPDDVGAFVARHRLRQVQITFDGLQANHDRRRHFRREYRSPAGASSFERAAALVDRLLEYTRVDVRYNVDPGNAGDFPGFLAFARGRGWFEAPFRCVVMPARLGVFSDRSQFMRRREVSSADFAVIEDVASCTLPARAQDDQDLVDGFPVPKTSVCGALAPDSAVVGADGFEYRCGLQVGETHRAVGHFANDNDPSSYPDRSWWDAFDPTELPTCSQCSFLPVCWGGCPKRHLEGDRRELAREGEFWRTHLPRMIAAGLGVKPPPEFAFTMSDQFRDSVPLS
jgi:uncharacterized protein